MRIYKQAGNIKAALFVGGILLVGGLLFYTQSLINDLREESKDVVSLYTQLMVKGIMESEDAELDFVFREIIQKVKFPIIYSDPENNPVNWRNLPFDEMGNDEQVIKHMDRMDKQNPPIPLIYHMPSDSGYGDKLVFGYFHYGDSKLIEQLQWLPYVEISAVALFILLGFVGFQVIRNNEKHHIWVGMARETAHQLGTPVSSLMGWLERLKEHPEKTDQTVTEMEYDMSRLQQISDRFSKMGSQPKMEEVNMDELVHSVAEYFRRRLPKGGDNISLQVENNDSFVINGNPTLLSWAVENLVKNAVDSIQKENGRVALSARKEVQIAVVRVSDNGVGIPRRDWKNVFRPGYSTKEHGWGLGLSLTKRIVEEFQNGTVEIVSSEIGKGTIFEMRIPVE